MTTVCGETQYIYVAEMATENWCCHTLLSSAISTTLVLEVARSTSGSNLTLWEALTPIICSLPRKHAIVTFPELSKKQLNFRDH